MCFCGEPIQYFPASWVFVIQPVTPYRTRELWLVMSFFSSLSHTLSPTPHFADSTRRPTAERMCLVHFVKHYWLEEGLPSVAAYVWFWGFLPFVPCAACHATCQACVGPEPSHCTECKNPEAGLQVGQLLATVPSGECLPRCRAQFYLESTGLCEGEYIWSEDMLVAAGCPRHRSCEVGLKPGRLNKAEEAHAGQWTFAIPTLCEGQMIFRSFCSPNYVLRQCRQKFFQWPV